MRQNIVLARDKAALLCIDLQEEHRQDKRYLVADFDRILAHIGRLQQAARDRGMAVCHAAYIVDRAAQKLRPFHPVMADGSSAFSDSTDPHSAVCAEVGPAEGEQLFIKSAASVFADGSVAPMLRARGIDWLMIAGVWTEACIDATVKDAVELGFRVLLIKDACGSGSTAMHETAILNLANRLYGGAVTDTDGACRLIGGATVDVWQVEGSVPLRFTYENAASLYRQL
jgi:nicotinamidase-related amidase